MYLRRRRTRTLVCVYRFYGASKDSSNAVQAEIQALVIQARCSAHRTIAMASVLPRFWVCEPLRPLARLSPGPHLLARKCSCEALVSVSFRSLEAQSAKNATAVSGVLRLHAAARGARDDVPRRS